MRDFEAFKAHPRFCEREKEFSGAREESPRSRSSYFPAAPPPDDPGAAEYSGTTYVGSSECATCHEDMRARFFNGHSRALKGPRRQRQGRWLRIMSRPGKSSCRKRRWIAHIVNPGKSPDTCFQCHLEVRAAVELPYHHAVLEGKVSCVDCHNPHKGDAIKGGATSGIQSLKGGGTALLGQNETCFQCHTAQRGPFVFEHEALREGCVVCHSPHGSVNQKLLTVRNQALCLKCHFQQQTAPGQIFIADVNHSSFLQRGTCWSAGCHEAVHGSQVSPALRF